MNVAMNVLSAIWDWLCDWWFLVVVCVCCVGLLLMCEYKIGCCRKWAFMGKLARKPWNAKLRGSSLVKDWKKDSPFFASLRMTVRSTGDQFTCSGSFVSLKDKRVALVTAAHCVNGRYKVEVTAKGGHGDIGYDPIQMFTLYFENDISPYKNKGTSVGFGDESFSQKLGSLYFPTKRMSWWGQTMMGGPTTNDVAVFIFDDNAEFNLGSGSTVIVKKHHKEHFRSLGVKFLSVTSFEEFKKVRDGDSQQPKKGRNTNSISKYEVSEEAPRPYTECRFFGRSHFGTSSISKHPHYTQKWRNELSKGDDPITDMNQSVRVLKSKKIKPTELLRLGDSKALRTQWDYGRSMITLEAVGTDQDHWSPVWVGAKGGSGGPLVCRRKIRIETGSESEPEPHESEPHESHEPHESEWELIGVFAQQRYDKKGGHRDLFVDIGGILRSGGIGSVPQELA